MRRHSSDILALGAIAIFAMALTSINYSWMFLNVEAAGVIDLLVYRGFFMNLSEHLKAFEGLYYTARLPPILVGAAFQPLPDAIGIVLMRLLYTGTSAFCVYFSISRASGNRIAGLATVLVLLTDTHVLSAVGSDYVNGAAFTFLSVGMASLIAASASNGHRRWLLLFLAGAALFTSIATHILSLMPAAFLCLLFVLLAGDRLSPLRLLQYGLPMTAGAISAIVVFGLASILLGGPFLFFLPQFLAAPNVATTWMPLNRPAGLLSLLSERFWSWPHLLVAAISIAVLSTWQAPKDALASRARTILVIQAAFVSLCLALEFLGVGFFRLPFNYVYPEIFTILAIGVLFGIVFRNESTRSQLIVVASIALLSICIWLSFRFGLISCADSSCTCRGNSCSHPDLRAAAAALIVGIVLVAAVALSKSGLQRVAAVSAAAVAWSMLSMTMSIPGIFDIRGGEQSRQSFLGFLAFTRSVNRFAPPETKYWFDGTSSAVVSDPQRKGLARILAGQASIWLYGYRLVSDEYPSLQHPYSGKVAIQDNDTIVALSAACSPTEQAENTLASAGYVIRSRARQTFDFNGTSICGDRMQIAAKLEPVGNIVARVDLSGIKSDPGGTAAFAAGALSATTLACQYCYSLRIPIPKQSRNTVARIKMRVESGSIGIGLSNSGDLSKLHQEKVVKAQPHDQTVDIKIDGSLDTDLIIMRNFATRDASHLTLESIVLHEADGIPSR